MSGDFTAEQKLYLEGFTSGLQAGRLARETAPGNGARACPGGEPAGPDAPGLRAQGRFIGGRQEALGPRESSSASCIPSDGYGKLKAQAATTRRRSPTTTSVGASSVCSNCAPTQKAYMCRLRIPNGILKHWQWRASPTSPRPTPAATPT
jgi:ferredoxin-nitrite reductase